MTPNPCSSGVCTFCECLPGYADCNGSATDGCEVSLATPANCGVCGTRCDVGNATATCINGNCVIEACDIGYANCDGDASNGCEQSVADDPDNCGGCGWACATSNSAFCPRECNWGMCLQWEPCDCPYADCDGDGISCEADLSRDTANCGVCGLVCGSGVCVDGVCQ
jgi:hypothetical protein